MQILKKTRKISLKKVEGLIPYEGQTLRIKEFQNFEEILGGKIKGH